MSNKNESPSTSSSEEVSEKSEREPKRRREGSTSSHSPVSPPPGESSSPRHYTFSYPVPSPPAGHIPAGFSSNTPPNQQVIWGIPNNQELLPPVSDATINRSSTTSFATGFFVLSEQPSARQRKSYPSEHRPLNPNPLTIVRRDQPGEIVPNITNGTVTVKLGEKTF
eukprot:TRINITY_DN136_c0_g1_i1.p1 TRINITY_DN136_c0_g1~~TRINITY_DN136_c0_g1_i1.p1  ORF type:complete len:167 (+),score=62.72 TRINITY_DN136_c0_g1_i1:259-759(+)